MSWLFATAIVLSDSSAHIFPCIIVLICQWLFVQRAVFREALARSSAGMSSWQFHRLVMIAILQGFLSLLLTICQFASIYSTHSNLPYINWNFVHAGFHRVDTFPAFLFVPNAYYNVYIYGAPVIGFLFCLFFSTTPEHLVWIRTKSKRARGFVNRSFGRADGSSSASDAKSHLASYVISLALTIERVRLLLTRLLLT